MIETTVRQKICIQFPKWLGETHEKNSESPVRLSQCPTGIKSYQTLILSTLGVFRALPRLHEKPTESI
jgi:hypothetical protein